MKATKKTYKIVGRTDAYTANRDIHFNGKTEVVLDSGLSLKEANKKLFDFFKQDYDVEFSNWGLARMNYPWSTVTYQDGTRGYDYDGRRYSVEEEIEK